MLGIIFACIPKEKFSLQNKLSSQIYLIIKIQNSALETSELLVRNTLIETQIFVKLVF